MDEELRKQSRGDLGDLKRCVFRAPVEFIRELHSKLTKEQKELSERLGVVELIAPRCKCEAISDGDCMECIALKVKADELLRYWKSHGVFARWLAGSEEMSSDAWQLVEAWYSAYGYTVKGCAFPECPEHYCQKHIWTGKFGGMADRSKPHG